MPTLVTPPLGDLLTRRALRKLAGKRRYDRGAEAFASGQVSLVEAAPAAAQGVVAGSKGPFEVHLGSQDGEFRWACTCRNGQDGEFCKHAVAVAVAWQAEQKKHAQAHGEADSGEAMDEMRDWLRGLKKSQLVDWLIEEARLDPSFYQWILEKMIPTRTAPGRVAAGQTIQELWDSFQRTPSYDLYQLLRAYTEPLQEWPLWREKALQHLLRTDPAARQRPDRQEAVETLLTEKGSEALQESAFEAAVAREDQHPEESLAVYQRLLEPTLARKNNEAYSEALAILAHMRRVLGRLGRQAEFQPLLEDMRHRHKGKRGFIKLLESQSWAQDG